MCMVSAGLLVLSLHFFCLSQHCVPASLERVPDMLEVRKFTEKGKPKNPELIGKIRLASDDILGHGSHGTVVFRGFFENRPVAIKRLLKEFYEIANHEVDLLLQSDNHPNIVRYFCKEESEQFCYIALELCEGSLVDFVEQKVAVALSHLDIVFQLLNGLNHLHNLNLVHRDIKPQNVLITRQFGTQGWVAPEMLFGQRMTKFVDVFSTGCVIYYILSGGSHPFGRSFERECKIRTGTYELSCVENNPEALNLIAKMISLECSERPTIKEVLKHPFFWSNKKKLQFLTDLSDWVETEKFESSSNLLSLLQKNASQIYGANWKTFLHEELVENLEQFRSYHGWRLRDLLRCIRNKKSHYSELSIALQQILGPIPDEYSRYFTSRFPKLLISLYLFILENNLASTAKFERYF
ncbi:hypothetical protein Zmor_022110 [Zophobas morio]|uniref:non-specific serine/threonine protein kinase n=1 Tax=Zophobas morio TaxID=2755281 RepID=A0AA38HJB6_9CUCU|nr:hypothetical protein Zmor_022110 [Zophobas morio]